MPFWAGVLLSRRTWVPFLQAALKTRKSSVLICANICTGTAVGCNDIDSRYLVELHAKIAGVFSTSDALGVAERTAPLFANMSICGGRERSHDHVNVKQVVSVCISADLFATSQLAPNADRAQPQSSPGAAVKCSPDHALQGGAVRSAF